MAEQKKIPITRISRFFGSQDFQLEQEMGMEWLHGYMHFTLVLFRSITKRTRGAIRIIERKIAKMTFRIVTIFISFKFTINI